MEPAGVRDAEMRARLEGLGPELRRQLRQSYRCDCVERHDRRPGRVTLPSLEADPGENVLDKVEEACGVRPEGCPFRATLDPFVARVSKAHRAWKSGHAIEEAALRAGVEMFDAAINAVEVFDMRAEREKPPTTKPTTVVGRRPGKRR